MSLHKMSIYAMILYHYINSHFVCLSRKAHKKFNMRGAAIMANILKVNSESYNPNYINVVAILGNSNVNESLFREVEKAINLARSIKHSNPAASGNAHINLALMICPDFYAFVADTDDVTSAYTRIKAEYASYVSEQSTRDENGFAVLNTLALPRYTIASSKK